MHKLSRIAKIGVEAEGFFSKSRPEIQKLIYCDQSVEFNDIDCYDADDAEEYAGQWDMTGEIASKPHSNLRELSRWIKEHYPDKTNKTCGLHIHCSFKKLDDYALVMHKKFNHIFLESMNRWGKRHCSNKRIHENKWFWDRLEGNNDFCEKEHYPIEQIKYNREKYTQLNYQSFNNYKTMECRLFPAFKNVDKSISGIAFFVRMVDYYLKHMTPNKYTEKYLDFIKNK